MKLFFIVNPISGGVDKEPFLKKAKKLCNYYGIEFKIFKTTGKNDEEEVLKSIEAFKPDKIASVGGDGTTLFCATTLLNTSYPMGIIPLGSANGMAAELLVNPVPIEALKDIIMSEIIEGIDILLINNKHYTMHIGDVGINASIVEAYENDKNRGMATYAKYFIDELNRLKPFKVTVKTEGKTIITNVFMAAICNARKYGTGVLLNDSGNMMDGKFEIVLVEKINLSSLLKAGLSAFNDEFYDSQSGQVISTNMAEIIFEEPRLLQLDGEVIEYYKNIKVELLEAAVKFITHNRNGHLSE
jgi:diacylglycerol kinase family enzyme